MPDQIEVSFTADPGPAPNAPLGIPIFKPVPGSTDPAAGIGGKPIGSGAQMGLQLTYGE